MLPFQSSSHSPIWNAAGTLGFTPPRRGPLSAALGAFVTNPISWGVRTPAQIPRLLEYPGGVLLHTGLPNPGLRQVLRQYAGQWARASNPVIVHLIAESAENVRRMVRQLEDVDGVAGLELGLPPDADPAFVNELIQAAQGELPLIVRLPFDADWPTPLPDFISLSPPRGTLPNPSTGFVQGRLLGPGLFPQALQAVRAWKQTEVPIVAGSGVYDPQQAEAMLDAGATAVQLDLRLWREPWPDAGWEKWLGRRGGGIHRKS